MSSRIGTGLYLGQLFAGFNYDIFRNDLLLSTGINCTVCWQFSTILPTCKLLPAECLVIFFTQIYLHVRYYLHSIQVVLYTHLPACKENISLYSRRKQQVSCIYCALLLNWTLDRWSWYSYGAASLPQGNLQFFSLKRSLCVPQFPVTVFVWNLPSTRSAPRLYLLQTAAIVRHNSGHIV